MRHQQQKTNKTRLSFPSFFGESNKQRLRTVLDPKLKWDFFFQHASEIKWFLSFEISLFFTFLPSLLWTKLLTNRKERWMILFLDPPTPATIFNPDFTITCNRMQHTKPPSSFRWAMLYKWDLVKFQYLCTYIHTLSIFHHSMYFSAKRWAAVIWQTKLYDGITLTLACAHTADLSHKMYRKVPSTIHRQVSSVRHRTSHVK